MSEADDEGGWKFEIEDLPGEDGEPAGETDGDGDDGEDGEGNVAGSMILDQSLEPGSPSLENTAFVVLGALCTVLFFLAVLGFI